MIVKVSEIGRTTHRYHHYEMAFLHCMNPCALAYAIEALLVSNTETVLCYDRQEINPIDYARAYNASGLIAMLAVSTQSPKLAFVICEQKR